METIINIFAAIGFVFVAWLIIGLILYKIKTKRGE